MTEQSATWNGCYDEGWKGMIVDEAFAHPAKISYSLAARIYEHAFKSGWLKPGDTVVDPFGGIGGTALHAAIQGVRWLGCELEPKFYLLANYNFDLWQRSYGHYPEWVRPTMLLGDSRNLGAAWATLHANRECVAALVASPPFTQGYASGGGINKNGYGDGSDKVGQRTYQGTGGDRANGNLESLPLGDIDAVLSSPPYAGDSGRSDRTGHERAERRAEETGLRQGLGCFKTSEAYGRTDGQLGAMSPGEPPAVVVSSPPYATGTVHDGNGIDVSKCTGKTPGRNSQTKAGGYGDSDGQLSSMVVGSPPFENQEPSHAQGSKFEAEHRRLHPTKLAKDRPSVFQHEYGSADGNIGNQSGDTFWQAARDIVVQCHAILRPGGVAIWVCKDFVRAKKRVPFSDQWLALCESVGFKLVCRHQASLVKRGGTQKLLDGGEHTHTTSRKSFFRRLAEKNGSPAIDHEDVICLEKMK